MTTSERTGLVPYRRTTAPVFLVTAAISALSIALAIPAGPVAVAVLALVAFGGLLLWLIDCSPGLASATLVVLLVAAWASVADLYVQLWWLDIVIHTAATGVLAAAATQALRHHRLLVTPRRHGVLLVIGCATAVGLSLGVVWEIAEWVGFHYVDDGVGVGYDDTIGDLAAGGAGSVVAGALLAWSWRRRG